MIRLEDDLKTKNVIESGELDASLMVYDTSVGNGSPKLRVAAAVQGHKPKQTSLELEVGDGIAGRAYKTNTYSCYDAEESEADIRLGVYIKQDGASHSFLHSIPLRHPCNQGLIFAILNIGTYDSTQGRMLRTLREQGGIKWLIEFGQNYVLRRILEIFKLEGEANFERKEADPS